MNETTKWACEYCTYENWPAAKKCILCHAPRPLQLISQHPESIPQEIYKVSSLINPRSDTNNSSNEDVDNRNLGGVGASVGGLPRLNKWQCHICTYLNWPKAQKCIQCLVPRSKQQISPSTSESSLTRKSSTSVARKMSPLNVNVNITESSITRSRSSPNNRSPKSPELNKELNNDYNRAIAAGNVKWNCKFCTYENWSKATKCIMCGVQRSPNSSRKNSAQGLNVNLNLQHTTIQSQGHLISDIMTKQNSALSNANRTLSMRQLPSPKSSVTNEIIEGATAATTSSNAICNMERHNRTDERRLKQIRNRMTHNDWLWVNACIGVIEGDSHAVEAFIVAGGDPARMLSEDEVLVLNRPSAFAAGYTLVHLAIRFKREDMLTVLLASSDVAKASKWVPSHVSPDVANEILREISTLIRQRKGDFPCYFLTECNSFILPADVENLPLPIHTQLFDELLDKGVQKELETEETIINWNPEITDRLGSRLYALWNRTAGDCLLDSVLQATWGVFDKDNTLRRALSDSLTEGACSFFPRWKEYESIQAHSLQFSLDENQWQQDWALLLSLASRPGSSLEQTHIFAVAHILRRPIIVYGVKFVKSFRGETIGFARFQGVYLPLLWEQSFCWKKPIALGYTRGHFSALVAMESDFGENIGAGANIDNDDSPQTIYLPLTDCDGKILPIHFLVGSEIGKEEAILREWLDCCETEGGLLVARVKFNKRSSLVKHMLDDWLDRYRRLAHVVHATGSKETQVLSSDGDTDDE